MLEEQPREEGDPDFELEKEFIFSDVREKHWKYVIVGKIRTIKIFMLLGVRYT